MPIANLRAMNHTVDEMSSGDDADIGLDEAAGRLAAAIQQLESRLETVFDKLDDASLSRREFDAMKVDRSRLARDLDNSRVRERELQRLADEASEALASAILEVRGALGKV